MGNPPPPSQVNKVGRLSHAAVISSDQFCVNAVIPATTHCLVDVGEEMRSTLMTGGT